MTRGQESLVMEEETLQITVTAVHTSRAHLKLAVVPASPDELDAHEDELQAIDKASDGACVWMTLRIAPAQLAVAA